MPDRVGLSLLRRRRADLMPGLSLTRAAVL